MNIDLLITQHNEVGLLCDRPFEVSMSGAIFDAETGEMTIEFGDSGEAYHLNIPIEDNFRDTLLFAQQLQVGMLENGLIAQSLQVPLLYLNDPYGSEFGQTTLRRATHSLIGFEQFMKRCVTGQPVHREDLSDENSRGCVLRGMDPAALQYVPQLIRQRMLEASPKLGAALDGPSIGLAPGMAPGGGSGTHRHVIRRHIPPEDSSET